MITAKSRSLLVPADLVCIFGGAGSQYTPPNSPFVGATGCNTDLDL